jgi:CHAT domain-containing protein
MVAPTKRRQAAQPQHELLALGDPTIASSTRTGAAKYRDLSLGALPDALREVRTLSTLYGRDRSKVLTGSAAREATVKKLAGGYQILHLATHGIVDDDSPLYSALVLARSPGDDEDGLLEMREIRNLDLSADLVILSACDTARGKVYGGEGVIGLSWAFFAAGCPTAVVSQWKAESASTSRLMIAFHRHLLRGETKADALRHAKLTLMSDPVYRHPFYWAPFIVIGDGASPVRDLPLHPTP